MTSSADGRLLVDRVAESDARLDLVQVHVQALAAWGDDLPGQSRFAFEPKNGGAIEGTASFVLKPFICGPRKPPVPQAGSPMAKSQWHGVRFVQRTIVWMSSGG
jgi:hypothetical protein